MDDVIKRMAEAVDTLDADVVAEELRTALRAVRDTHRLVPIEPTAVMESELSYRFQSDPRFPGSAYEAATKVAPDYTESNDG